LPSTFNNDSTRIWGISAIVGHSVVLVLNHIADVWKYRLEAKAYAERRKREQDVARSRAKGQEAKESGGRPPGDRG
jgi:hypothetical protein